MRRDESYMKEDPMLAGCTSLLLLLLLAGAVYKYDLSVPVSDMYSLVEEMRKRLRDVPDVVVAGYGHIGDGNLHLNISRPGNYSIELENLIEPFVYEWTAARGGSISAEHGLGLMKAQCIGYSKSAEAIDLMRKLKQLMDPHGILNPYKVLPKRPHSETDE
jgi:D-2-hydroxyglutarate dehydrogenase